MAKVTLGPIVSAISGSAGAATFNHRRGGTVLYQRPLPLRRPSDAQLFHRACIAKAALAWRALDAEYRTAWNFMADEKSIPDSFTRGRRWTGQQLFSCFFIAAERQYTPLPATWLPTFPYFHSGLSATVYFFYPDGDEPEVVEYSTCSLYCAVPTVPLEIYPQDYSYDCVGTFYMAIIPKGQRRPPSSFTQVAPTIPPRPSVTYPDYPFLSGYRYAQWSTRFYSVLGTPRGLVAGAPLPVPTPFSIACRAVSLTNERLYYTDTFYGDSLAATYDTNGIGPMAVNNPHPYAPYVQRQVYPGNIPA